MMRINKILWSILLVFICNIFYSQEKLPNITPPSPTVAALMKFQEMPVSNYTGIPDISIPLYNLDTSLKDINIDIQLKYHPANIQVDKVASDVGLGWSLFAGGTISRTVRGLPDEYLQFASNDYQNSNGKVGIYQTSHNNHNNLYYEYSQLEPSGFLSVDVNKRNEFYWETVNSNKYDTEHDLWQFSINGRSGKFMIEKDNMDRLIVKPLSDYRIKIINHYDTINGENFIPTGFTIYDDKGYRYEFDVFEETNTSYYINSINIVKDESNIIRNISTNTYSSLQSPYRSAFHLSQVYLDDILLYKINYDESSSPEVFVQTNTINNDYSDTNLKQVVSTTNCWNEFPPKKRTVVINNHVMTKKINKIIIPDRAFVEFEFENGRQDDNILEESKYLKSITLKNIFNQLISKFDFNYEYYTSSSKRMFLKELKFVSPDIDNVLEYKFNYNKYTGNPLLFGENKDYWGYFKAITNNGCNSPIVIGGKEASPSSSTTDLLNTIIYPSKGYVNFLFESNKYSFQGDQEITDFSKNPDNYLPLGCTTYTFSNDLNEISLPMSNLDRVAYFQTDITPNNYQRIIHLYEGFQSDQETILSLDNNNHEKKVILEAGKIYRLKYTNFDINYNELHHIYMKGYEITNDNKYLYGGGNRIKQIIYNAMDQEEPVINLGLLSNTILQIVSSNKTVKYDYSNPLDPSKSSGSLVFYKPSLVENNSVYLAGTNCKGLSLGDSETKYNFKTRYSSSSQETILTKSASVGYKNVRVYEIEKGSTEYTYTSPIDFPESNLGFYTKPYPSPHDIDYKRGLLLNQVLKDESGKVLYVINNEYEYSENERVYGYKIDNSNSTYFNGVLKNHNNYSKFKALYDSSMSLSFVISNPNTNDVVATNIPLIINGTSGAENPDLFSRLKLGPLPEQYYSHYPLKKIYGWSKLKLKTTKNYFYSNGNTPRITEKKENFAYNDVNKRVAEHEVISESNEVIKTKYYYDYQISLLSQNRMSDIKKIEKYKNGKLINTREIIYNNSWGGNQAFLPKEIKSALGNADHVTVLTYDRYDSKGNLLQYTSKKGVPTAIVWGYQQTKPIAQIVGATYGEVEELISTIINKSNLDFDVAAEQQFIDALDSFRKLEVLKDYQITTYTYDPLIGLTSITPPSGMRQVYLYDEANRLKEVREGSATGKLLKVHEYHYKP